MMKTKTTCAEYQNLQSTENRLTIENLNKITISRSSEYCERRKNGKFQRLLTIMLITTLVLGNLALAAYAQEKTMPAKPDLNLSALDSISLNSGNVSSGSSTPLAPSNPLSDKATPKNSDQMKSNATQETNVTGTNANSTEKKDVNRSQDSGGVSNTQNSSRTGSSVNDATSVDPAVSAPKSKFWDLVKAGGFIGIILLILSLIACTIVIQFCLTLRRSGLYPLSFAEEVQRLIDQGKYRFAHQLCGNSSTLLGQVIYKGLSEYQGEWAPVEKALEESVAEESAALYRKSELLSVIGNIAPMLGLLGTVIGMVVSFGELASSDGLGRNLAQGIYFALVTTVDGLIVAIPALVTYSIINNVIASRISEMTDLIDQILRPMKKASAGSVHNSAPASGRPAIPPFPSGR